MRSLKHKFRGGVVSEENKAVVRRFYQEVMMEGRLNVLDEIMAEDFDDHGDAIFGSPQGREALRQAIAAAHGALTNMNVDIQDMIAEKDLVGLRGTERAIQEGPFLGVPGTGNQLTWWGMPVFRVVEGRIAARWFNADSLSILQQLGIASSTPTGQ